MRIILPTDVFPPDGKGGAAWSTHALARALIERGHMASVVVPIRGQRGRRRAEALGVPTLRVGYGAPRLPIVQNLFRHELLWRPLAQAIVAEARRGPPPDLIHVQHVQTAPAAVIAGRALGVPVVVTVRDHWPWDYFATGLHGDRIPYAGASWASMATDLTARQGALRGALLLPAIPYMLGHLRRRQAYLAQADAVIAVSGYIAGRLAGIVAPERIHVLPNIVDLPQIDRTIATPPETPLRGPTLLFVGKLEPNKGARLLAEVFRSAIAPPSSAAGRRSPPLGATLIIAGDGALRGRLERELGDLGVGVVFLAWAGHDEVLRLMARCDLLLFPSAWGEPLSRVLLEAAAVGAPILAMPTGGTPDVVVDGVSGALAATPQAFAARLRALLDDPAERARLGRGARALAQARFSHEALLPRYEALYREVARRPAPGSGR